MDWIISLDHFVADFMAKTFRNGFLDAVMPVITLIAEKGLFLIAMAVVLICMKKTRKTGFAMAVAITISFILCNLILKNAIDRPRPDISLWNPYLFFAPIDSSFPSGHTAVSFASATALFYANKKVGTAALLLAALVGFSRIYLCVHFLSDVVAGVFVGILAGILAVLLVKYLYTHRKIDKL